MDGVIRAKLGLDCTGWRKNSQDAAADVARLTREVSDGRAAVAAFEQQMRAAGPPTAEAVKQLKEAQSALSQYEAALKRAEKVQRDFNAASAHAAPKPSEKLKYQTERSNREQRMREKGEKDKQDHASFERTRANVIADAYEKEAEIRSGSEHGSGGRGRKGEKGGEEEEHGSGRAANQEAGHSIRSIMDMIGAGTNPVAALRAELPRIAQAAGLSLGTQIAIELIPAVLSGIESAVNTKADERQKFGSEMAGSGVGLRYNTDEGLRTRIDELQKDRDERLDATGAGTKNNNWFGPEAAARGARNLWRKVTGQQSVEDEEADKIAALDQKRIDTSNELARRKDEEVKMDEKAFTEGERAVAIDRIKLSILQQIREIQSDPNMDGTAAARMVDSLHEQEKVLENIKQIELDREQNARSRRNMDTSGDHVGMTDGSHVGTQRMDVNADWAKGSKSLRHALNARDEATANLQSVKDHGGDTAAAQQDLQEAEARVRDQAIEEEMKGPRGRHAEQTQQRARDQAEQRLLGRMGLHPWYNGSTKAKDATPGGDPIPEHLPGHESSDHLPGFQDIPDVQNPTFQDLLNQNHTDYLNPSAPTPTMPAPEPTQASNDAPDYGPVVDAINSLGSLIVTATTATV